MKTSYFIFSFILLCILSGCNDGIDPIQPYTPGADKASPEINILYPIQDGVVRSKEEIMSIDFKFKVSDDIEIKNATIFLDNNKLKVIDSFLDYRNLNTNFTYDKLNNGSHNLTITATDAAGNHTTKSISFTKAPPYKKKYMEWGEMFYMPFDGDYYEQIELVQANIVGEPTFTKDSKFGSSAYAGNKQSYLTYTVNNLNLQSKFSATFWYNVNAGTNRAGILVMSPMDENNPDNPNNRKNGFRLFREDVAGKQRIKLNIGIGKQDVWLDGGTKSDIEVNDNKWHFIAFSIDNEIAKLYIDNNLVAKNTLSSPISWSGIESLSIGSGEPNFTGWGHKSDTSYIDEIRLFNKALNQEQLNTIMNNE